MKIPLLRIIAIAKVYIGVLFENRPALYFCNNNNNNNNKNTSMLDTSFIDDFIDIMEQYCYYRNRFKIFNLRLSYIKNLKSIFDTESTNIYSIDSKKNI